MNPKILSDDRIFNVGGQIRGGTLCPRTSAIGDGELLKQKSRRQGGVGATKNRSAKSSTAQFAQSSKTVCLRRECL